ncbi:MAG: hypothetical protein U0871_16530 [Gemmataceae bacterium]
MVGASADPATGVPASPAARSDRTSANRTRCSPNWAVRTRTPSPTSRPATWESSVTSRSWSGPAGRGPSAARSSSSTSPSSLAAGGSARRAAHRTAGAAFHPNPTSALRAGPRFAGSAPARSATAASTSRASASGSRGARSIRRTSRAGTRSGP